MREEDALPTLTELLLQHRDDDHLALLTDESSWTWREFVTAAAVRSNVALELRRPGPFHVGVLLPTVPEFLFWVSAMALNGGAVVGINPTRRGAELAADVRHTDCQLVVTDAEGLAQLADVGIATDRALCVDSDVYRERLAWAATAEAPDLVVGGDAPVLLLFTSGSTGAPKAVVCSQWRAGWAATEFATNFGLTRDDILYESLPLFHSNALLANFAPAVAAGATVALRERFSASRFLYDVRRFGATYFNYVGRTIEFLLATPAAPDDADNPLRFGFGNEASARDRERFGERFACPLIDAYGQSEMGVTLLRPPEAPPDSLGVALGGDVAVVDPETGEECPRARLDACGGFVNSEAIGELVNRAGAPMFEGYWRNDEATNERVRDGWFWSGDLAYRDEQGWFWFAGRSSERLRVDGENFAAGPIERILERAPGVVAAAVYPVPDEDTGDQVMAALELADRDALDPVELGAFLERQPDLGTKWAPRYVRIVTRLPHTANNKVHKPPLRRERWETADPVYWRAKRSSSYARMTPVDVEALRQAFHERGRGHVLSGA